MLSATISKMYIRHKGTKKALTLHLAKGRTYWCNDSETLPCRGGPMCPPVLIGALYALRADTQVRPYTSYINTTTSPINRCSTSIIIDSHTQKDLVRGPTNHSRGSKGQSPERPTDARRLLIYRPPRVGLDGFTVPVRPPAQGRSLVSCGFLLPQSFGALLLRLGAMIRPTASGRLLFLLCNTSHSTWAL